MRSGLGNSLLNNFHAAQAFAPNTTREEHDDRRPERGAFFV